MYYHGLLIHLFELFFYVTNSNTSCCPMGKAKSQLKSKKLEIVRSKDNFSTKLEMSLHFKFFVERQGIKIC